MRAMFDVIPEGIFIVDAQYRIINCNAAFCVLLAKNKKDIINKKCYELIHGERRRIKTCLMCRAKKTGRVIKTERWENHLAKKLNWIKRMGWRLR